MQANRRRSSLPSRLTVFEDLEALDLISTTHPTLRTSQQTPDVCQETSAVPRPYVTPSASSEHGSPCNLSNTSGSYIPIDRAGISGPLMSLPDPH